MNDELEGLNEMTGRLSFASDYMEGAHPSILERLAETNYLKTSGYGLDEYCDAARAKIRAACGAPDADVFFLVGGTQTNATVIDALLQKAIRASLRRIPDTSPCTRPAPLNLAATRC